MKKEDEEINCTFWNKLLIAALFIGGLFYIQIAILFVGAMLALKYKFMRDMIS